ncbi:MAG: GGDEF domain-containing protein [Rubrivivax sp.]|nr:GGDEF domain-containing protein [Rubrivivax sp.]
MKPFSAQTLACPPGWRRVCHALALLLVTLLAALPARAGTLVVDGRSAVPVWPAVSILHDGNGQLSAEQALAARARFEVPAGTAGNLGRIDGVVWLRFHLQVPGGTDVERVLEIDYPPLNRIDVLVLHEGQPSQRLRLGNELRLSERPLHARTHAAALRLAPGEHEVLLRVQTQSSMVLPITLRTPAAFTEAESRVQLVQGIVAGLGLCMLIYSLLHWVSLRDPMFIDYALLLTGNGLFVWAYFGIGAQHLWPDAPEISKRLAPMAVMLAVVFGTRFILRALMVDEVNRPVALAMRCIGAAAGVGLVLTLLGLLDYRAAQTLITVLGVLAIVIVLPVAFMRARSGERVARYMLIGWAFYTLGVLTTAGLLRGALEPTFWTQHVYPFSLMLEMSAWMGVLGLRVQEIHRSADRARVETETLRTLAHTDALTGLPNRRGLQNRLADALRDARPQALLAVYLLDLDGFKPVNDRFGHDVGDALLVAVGGRLRAQLRGSDVVARLGGDEFVVLAAGLADERQAHTLGQKLLAAFDEPFDADGQRCEVGLTVGYALAPLDGSTADELLKRADAAMYAGKQAGRRRAQRGGRATAPG